ncbi:MAG: S8 family serine peptidase [Acidobacteria bacterium]|nr:S8 family serine peptidase [Acidobacteriota bacterium]
MRTHSLTNSVVFLVVFILILSLAGFGVPRGGWHYGQARRPHRPAEILVKPMPGTTIQSIAARYQLTVIDQVTDLAVWRLRIPPTVAEEELLERMNRDLTVDFTDYNYLMTSPEAQQESLAFVDQTDPPFIDGSSPPGYFNPEIYDQIGARPAWAYSTGRNVTVAVVDTGVNRTHPALQGHLSLEQAWNFIDGNPNPEEEAGGRSSGHGTFVTGLIARVAPEAKILPLRALNREGIGDTYQVAQAIIRAANAGAQIINLSLGLTSPAYVIDDAIEFAAGAGTAMLASAGNNNRDEDQYIASNENVLGVSAVDPRDFKAAFSNYGAYVGVAGPGVQLYSTFINRQFASWSGTSFSTALVSGQAALLKGMQPALRTEDLFDIIRVAADNIDSLNPAYIGLIGSGRINCIAAIRILQ